MGNEWASGEMQHAGLSDQRRIKSLVRICEKLAAQPGAAFSAACGSASRQAARRIFKHPQASVDTLLQGHYQETAARCGEHPVVFLIQDTTALEFHGLRATTGLGPITDKQTGRGLFAHSVLAITPTGLPLGLLHVQLWARAPAAHGKTRSRRSRLPEEKESAKWRQAMASSEQRLAPQQEVLLIQDREADVFDFLAAPRRPTTHLLLRASQARRVLVPQPEGEPQQQTLFEAAAAAPQVGKLSVKIGRKPGQPEREAVLVVRTAELVLQPPQRKGVSRVPQRVWVIQARETEPPAEEEGVEWTLLTTLPVTDGEAACQRVRDYARRWTIERLHFTLKSGCAAEKLQMDTAHSLMCALALYYVVVWRLLYLTHLARTEPDKPADELLTAEERAVLTQREGRTIRTARGAVEAIAKMGGFEPYRGGPEPGVKSLWLGLRRLEAMAEGWRLAWEAFRDSASQEM